MLAEFVVPATLTCRSCGMTINLDNPHPRGLELGYVHPGQPRGACPGPATEPAQTWTVHPGEILKEALVERHMTQAEFAQRMDLSQKQVSFIVNGKAGYSADIALRMERVLGISAVFWLNALANHKTEAARMKEGTLG
jgi:addiction module HigA family antidote